MSGSNAIPPIRLTLDGKDAVERGMEEVARAAERMAQRTQAGTAQMGTLATAADDVGARLGTLSTRAAAFGTVLERMGQSQAAAGLGALVTVLDSAALAASRVGANAVAAETGVSSFFARMATGATIIGAVAAALQAAGLGINAAGEGALRAADYSARYQQTLESLNGVLGTTAQRAQEAALALFRTNQQAALVRAETGLGQVFEQRSAGVTAFNANQQAIERQRAAVATAEGRVSGAWSPLQRRAFEGQLEQARAELSRLEGEGARLVVRNAELNQQETELVARRQDLSRQTGPDDFIGPPAPAASTRPSGGGGGRPADPRDDETGYTARQAAALDRLRQAEEREAQRTADREQRDLERREERNNRVTDRIVDYSAERFAELFDKNGRGWEGMLDTLERTAKSTMARIAAELVLRPIIAPIVAGLGLGALGAGNGGFSGFGGLAGGGGDLGGGGGTGGLTQLFGLARSGYSAYSSLSGGSSSGGGMLGGLMSTPVWTSGGGWFGAPAVASGGYLPAGASSMGMSALPPMSGATTGMGTASTASLGSVLGAGAAGVGIGYMGGSALGGAIAGDSPARRTNANIGAGGGALSGAVAGAMIGSVVPVIGTAIGALIGGIVGGLAGGAGGGMIGPGRPFRGGDVAIGLSASGQLEVVGSGGKRFNTAEAENDTRDLLSRINTLMAASGVSVDPNMIPRQDFRGQSAIGVQGFGESRNVFGPTEIFQRIRPGLSSSNANLQQVLGSGRIASFDELGQVAAFITQIYEPLNKARDYTREYALAIGAQLSVYDQAIQKARELGLAETGLIAARERAQNDLLKQRNTDVYTQQETLRIAELRLSSSPADQRRADMMEFNLRFGRGDQDLQDFLRSSGYGDETELFQDTLARYRRITEIERTRAEQASNDRVGGSGRSLMEDLTVGGLGGLSPGARYAAGLRVLQDARRSGNLDRITAAARTVLPVARDFLGTSERYGALVADIGRDVRRLGGDPVGLGVFLEGQAAGNQALERIYGLNNLQLTELKSMRTEISRLNAVLTTLMQRG